MIRLQKKGTNTFPSDFRSLYTNHSFALAFRFNKVKTKKYKTPLIALLTNLDSGFFSLSLSLSREREREEIGDNENFSFILE